MKIILDDRNTFAIIEKHRNSTSSSHKSANVLVTTNIRLRN